MRPVGGHGSLSLCMSLRGCLFELFTIFGLVFGRSKICMTLKMRSWEAHEKCFQLLAFGDIQFLDLPKANKENDKKLKTNTL
jgi:hypothetical protein